MDYDDDLIEEIAPHVLRALDSKRFFQKLDDEMCPRDPTVARLLCQGTLAITTTTLVNCGFEREPIEDVLAVLAAKGGFCDCEVLYNAAEESRLKSEYWKAVASKRRPLHGHGRLERSVRVWMWIEKDDVGYPESQDWEDLWGQPISEGRVVIESVPFFVKGVARGDQAIVAVSEDGLLVVKEVAERSRHSTFRIWLAEPFLPSSCQLISDLEQMGAVVEVTLERLLAIDASPARESDIWDYLQEGQIRGTWELQVGYSPD